MKGIKTMLLGITIMLAALTLYPFMNPNADPILIVPIMSGVGLCISVYGYLRDQFFND